MNYDRDIIIIGGGSAGLYAATQAAAAGARTALIEKGQLGGNTTWTGGVPANALLRSAKTFNDARRLSEFGVVVSPPSSYDTGMVMDHARSIMKKIGDFEAPEYYENRGIEIRFDSARFLDRHTVEVDGTPVTANHFIICTGSHPLLPAIEGLRSVPYFTNETIFNLQLLPRSLAVIGGGTTGVEIAQAFALLGVAVTLIVRGERILPREDDEAARLLQQELQRNRIDLRTACTVTKVAREDDRRIVLDLQTGAGERQAVRTEMLFIAAGILPNVDGLALDKAGIAYSAAGIEVDETLRTTAENIFACGDVVRRLPFANAAEYQAGIAVRNALTGGREGADYRSVPWCVFTEPALAHFGPTELEAREHYDDLEVYKIDYRDNDQAVAALEDIGFAKVLCTADGKIVGAHIVGASAGEIINTLVTARAAGMTLSELGKLVFVYPSLSEMLKRLGEQYAMRKNYQQRRFVPA